MIRPAKLVKHLYFYIFLGAGSGIIGSLLFIIPFIFVLSYSLFLIDFVLDIHYSVITETV